MNLDGSGHGKELGGIVGGKIIIRIYYMRREFSFNGRKKYMLLKDKKKNFPFICNLLLAGDPHFQNLQHMLHYQENLLLHGEGLNNSVL